jgi:hypothetical protein
MSLVEDAVAAKKAGMTYGQYMSQKAFVPYKRVSGKKCIVCGSPLVGKQMNWCSKECRDIRKMWISRGGIFV